MSKHYLCTRPKLAAVLTKAGIPVTRTSNPFADDAAHSEAWDIALNQKAAAIIADYYTQIGKPVPATVAAYLKGGVNRA